MADDGAPTDGPPPGSRWSPVTWWRILKWRWRLYGPVEGPERRGYWFWLPIIFLVLLLEVLAAVSSSVRDAIPWPTISSTVGHLEKRWDWVAVIVVGLITIIAFHVFAYRSQQREEGRAFRRVQPTLDDPAATPEPRHIDWYTPVFVVIVEAVAIVLAIVFGAGKYQLGYVIYGVLAVVGIVIPSILSFSSNRIVGFPTMFFTVDKLRHRLHFVAIAIIAGLSILAVHLAFYPWPDITHESASFAGLTADKARTKAEQGLKATANHKPGLVYSTQSRAVVDGSDVWLVYFRPASGTGATCVVTVTKKDRVSASPECLVGG